MIVGVGTDMVEIGRMEKACRRPSFLDRVFTEEERRQAGGKISRLAGDFAVKEAVSKVLGTSWESPGSAFWGRPRSWHRREELTESMCPSQTRRSTPWRLRWGKESRYEISGAGNADEGD